MKLIKIEGNIWELSTLQSDEYSNSENDKTTLEEKNIKAIKNQGWFRGIVRTIANHGVKSKAKAIVEVIVNGLPTQIEYEIYHNSKGFFCKIQGSRVFLVDIIEPPEKQGDE